MSISVVDARFADQPHQITPPEEGEEVEKLDRLFQDFRGSIGVLTHFE